MPVANVKSEWVDGNLVFYDKSRNIICTFDGTNRAVTFPSGSTINLPDEVLAAADIALAEGSILVGNAGGAAEALNAKTTTYVLVGNGTTITSVALSGDATMSGAGVVAIGTGVIVDADVNASAAIARSKLAEDALSLAMALPIASLRSDAGASLTAAETAGTFNVSVAANVILAQGEITDNETEVSVCYGQVVLPPEYVAAGDVTVRVPCALIKTAAAVNNGSTIDVAVFEQAAGAVGADLSTTTAAATFAADDTWYNKDFVITATGLVAGDVLNLKFTSSVVDSEVGAGTLRLNMGAPIILLDIKG